MTGRRLSRNRACFAVLLLTLAPPTEIHAEDEPPVTLVGMRGHLEGVVLPGSELEVRPLEDSQAPFVLRIANVYQHGTAYRYDFVYYALEPRSYDLRNYLRRKDGSTMQNLPPLEVKVKGLLGSGLIHPHAPEAKQTSWFAGYRVLVLAGAGLWCVGLFLILFWGRRKKKRTQQDATPPTTAADRLRPLVIRAMTGLLSAKQHAELERTLLAFWRQRLGLENDKPHEALAKLRQHPEAGVLLNQLELWLHRPGTAKQVDVGKLLWVYQQAPIEKQAAAAGAHGARA